MATGAERPRFDYLRPPGSCEEALARRLLDLGGDRVLRSLPRLVGDSYASGGPHPGYRSSGRSFAPPSGATVAHRTGGSLPPVKLVTYGSPSGPRAGVLTAEGAIDAWEVLGEPGNASLRELLASGRLDELAGADGAALADPELLPPIPDPQKIVCVGLNYRSHAAEAGIEPPDSPTFFAKFANALAPPGATVTLPGASEKIDYEAEIAFLIGRRARLVDEAAAMDHVAGYMLFNDLSARDLQFATPQWMPGKVFDGSAPSGPALVTPEEAGAPDEIEFELALNGETMQSASTADLIFSVPALVSQLSALMTLEPGDIVATGTPPGVGGAREPRVWLQDGDEIAISSPSLGRLVTHIAGS
jgi:2-keto-4-pentenoate hydratase/2-oxohepta-3-ene-1,7-dioic acid hydratase in catechol pathway